MQKPVSAAQTFQKLLLGLVALVVIIAALVGITRLFSGRSAANAAEPLIQLRAEHETQLTQQGPSPQAGETEMQTRFAPNWLNFESDGRLLFGCLRLPEGDGPHPVVVYCHGGFAMGASDIEEVDPLLKAGYAVFVPAWRGENGNAGNFEMFYGEVDDVIAAMEYLGRLPQIDENAISLVGHSAGATLALLAAECSDLPRTVIACSPVVDMTELVRLYGPEMYEEAPFDIEDTWETDLRSPIHFLDE